MCSVKRDVQMFHYLNQNMMFSLLSSASHGQWWRHYFPQDNNHNPACCQSSDKKRTWLNLRHCHIWLSFFYPLKGHFKGIFLTFPCVTLAQGRAYKTFPHVTPHNVSRRLGYALKNNLVIEKHDDRFHSLESLHPWRRGNSIVPDWTRRSGVRVGVMVERRRGEGGS